MRLIKIVDEIRKEIECCCSWTRYEAITLLLNQLEEELGKENMWDHFCKRERSKMSVGKGEPCNWCGLTEEENE